MKKPLLAIVQEIASDIDTDVINSITDTPEAMQIATIVQSTYEAIISNRNWPHTRKLVNITPSTDNLKPNLMTIEDHIKEMISVYYDTAKNGETRKRFSPIKYIEPDDMLRLMYGLNTDEANVMTVDGGNGQVWMIRNDQPPRYFTTFDDNTLVFDAYDSSVDSTLQAHKTQVRAYVMPQWEMRDDFVPDLPEEAFTYLIEEAKSKAAYKIPQKPDEKAEQESRRQNQWLSRKAFRVAGGVKYPNYGRNRFGYSGYKKDPTFRQED